MMSERQQRRAQIMQGFVNHISILAFFKNEFKAMRGF